MSQKKVSQHQWLKFLPKSTQLPNQIPNDQCTKANIQSIPISPSFSKTDRGEVPNHNNKVNDKLNDKPNSNNRNKANTLCLFDTFKTFSNNSSVTSSNDKQPNQQIDYSKLKTISHDPFDKLNKKKKKNQLEGYNVFLNKYKDNNDDKANITEAKVSMNNNKIGNQLNLSSLAQYRHNEKALINNKSNSSFFNVDNDEEENESNTTMISKNTTSRRCLGYPFYNQSMDNSRDTSLNKETINNNSKAIPKQSEPVNNNSVNHSQFTKYQKISTYRSPFASSQIQQSQLHKTPPKSEMAISNKETLIDTYNNRNDNTMNSTKGNNVKDNYSISHHYNNSKKKMVNTSYSRINQRNILRNYSNTVKKTSNNNNNNQVNIQSINKHPKPNNNRVNANSNAMTSRCYNNNNISNNEVIELIEDIKDKYRKEEKSKINKESELLSEISILRSKLKEMAINEANTQIELEKLKRQAKVINTNKEVTFYTKRSINNRLNLSNEDDSELNKLNKDLSINNTKTSQQSFNAKETPRLKSFLYLCKEFNINKGLIYDNAEGKGGADKNFIDDTKDKENIITALNDNPTLKAFITTIANRLNHECKSRMQLEEKSLKIFINDMKTIDALDRKVKILERRTKSANVSLNSNDISNCTINSC